MTGEAGTRIRVIDVPDASDVQPNLLSRAHLGPFAEYLGLQITSSSPDQVEATWTVTDGLLQPYGMLHGGAHCGVVETLASLAASLWLGEEGRVVGTSNTTDFYRASRSGDQLRSICRPLHRGRSRQVWRVETFDDQHRLVSAGQVSIQNLRR
jgi:1,4-dihydroxy-2-naphthoyl-CoA hydrolase